VAFYLWYNKDMVNRRFIGALVIVLFCMMGGIFFGLKVAGMLVAHERPAKQNTSASITPTATPTPAPISTPVTLTIPKLKIKAPIELVGLDPQGRMDVPKNPDNVAWYKFGVTPGSVGNAVIAGHLDWTAGPAVFQHLASLKKDDKFTVTDSANTTHAFRVIKTATYPFDQFPNDTVFGPSTSANLNLITCAGSYDKKTKNYSHRVVVYAELVQ
jgi:LPXTG-site transpeptidase (sortase) family protein